jgi:lipopolysaccharide export system permease protein
MRTIKLDRYLLELLARPVAAALGVTLIAQLLDRILKIINQLAENGAHFGFLFQLTVNLVPYYLTFSLPASFFVAIFLVVARMGDGNEIDAILASGVSIPRFAAPFVVLGVVFSLLSLALFGFLQPYGRYAYNAVLNAALNAGWNAQLQPEVFTDPGHGLTITADRVGMSGRSAQGVFIRRSFPDGREQITTAKSGVLKVSPDGSIVELVVGDGLQIDQPPTPGAAGRVTHFHNVSAAEPLAGPEQKMRPRGGDVRELTLFELTHELRSPNPVISKNTLAAELYGRLARSLSVPFLPLLALPLGMAAKRGRRAPGLILAGVVLIGFHHAVDMTQNLAQSGRAPPGPSIWGIYFVFIGLCSWLFLSSLRRPGDTPITRAVATVDAGVHWLRDLMAPEPEASATS